MHYPLCTGGGSDIFALSNLRIANLYCTLGIVTALGYNERASANHLAVCPTVNPDGLEYKKPLLHDTPVY